MKKLVLLGVIVASGLTLTVINLEKGETVKRTVVIEGSYDTYKNFQDLDEVSPLIVIGNVQENFEKARFKKATEESGVPYAERDIVVTKVLKNTLSNNIKSGDKLILLEPSAIVDDTEGRRTLYKFVNYIGVKKAGGPVMFFLTKSSYGDAYALTNLNLARFPLGSQAMSDFFYNKTEERAAQKIMQETRAAGLLK